MLFVEVSGLLPMCGHGTIGVATVLVETGMVAVTEPETVIRFDTPAGLVEATVTVTDGHAERVRLRNVPAFVVELDAEVEVPSLGTVRYDMAFGGNFYALVAADSVGLDPVPENSQRLIDAGLDTIDAINLAARPAHPLDPAISGCKHVVFHKPGHNGAHARNATSIHPGLARPLSLRDRHVGADGGAARAAASWRSGEEFVNESVIGSRFTGRLLEETGVGELPAVIPEVSGRAWVTGMGQYLLDPTDPFPSGFDAVNEGVGARANDPVVVVGGGAVGLAIGRGTDQPRRRHDRHRARPLRRRRLGRERGLDHAVAGDPGARPRRDRRVAAVADQPLRSAVDPALAVPGDGGTGSRASCAGARERRTSEASSPCRPPGRSPVPRSIAWRSAASSSSSTMSRFCIAAFEQAELEHLLRVADELARAGGRAPRRLSAAETMSAEPALGDGVVGGLIADGDSRVRPESLTAGLQRALEARGVAGQGGRARDGADPGPRTMAGANHRTARSRPAPWSWPQASTRCS